MHGPDDPPMHDPKAAIHGHDVVVETKPVVAERQGAHEIVLTENKKRISWKDFHGQELHTVQEFERSEEEDSRYSYEAKACCCIC